MMIDRLELDARLAGVFLGEAHLRLAEMRTGLDALRAGDVETVALLWRGAHTLRGNAAMVGLREMAECAAWIERHKQESPEAQRAAVLDIEAAIAQLVADMAMLEASRQTQPSLANATD